MPDVREERMSDTYREDDGKPMTLEQQRLLLELHGLRDQIEKGHFLNVHFRAFQLAHAAWQKHIRQNAVARSRSCNSPAGAVLDDERSDQ